MRILIAEDNEKLLKSLLHVFQRSKFAADGVGNGRDALDYALSGEYDGIVLDVMMPEKDGLQVPGELRRSKINTPVLLLTARTQIEQRVEGLDAGADDYLTKPFAVPELLARVRAMARRRDTYTPEVIELMNLTLNCSLHELSCRGRTVALSSKEFQIMELFMTNPRVIISGERLITHIWGWEDNVDMGVVWAHISNLRKKLAQIESNGQVYGNSGNRGRRNQGCADLV